MTSADPVFDIGKPPEHPTVSVVVPIYGRYDFIEYQLSLFADDADWKDTELIYVLDDPRIAQDAVNLCREIHPLFRVPIRVVGCRRNRGFAAATNVGVTVARGRLILLLNSDVMPRRPGWISELRRLYDSIPSPGALGPKLLFPDGSLQHAGMSFEQLPRYPGIWLNDHPGKGLPSEVAPKGTLTSVPALTAACLMVSKQLYREIGGMDESYILGDFEDSDFCLKLRRAGRQICCAPSVELYHLERQSQRLIGGTEWRSALTLYNAWLHTKRWGDSIRHLTRETV
jgi:GT2 family glycosyltransferase